MKNSSVQRREPAGFGDCGHISAAKVVRLKSGIPVTTDGPFAESKESLIGYWIVDVENEARAIEIASRIIEYSEVVEVRQVMDAPPEI